MDPITAIANAAGDLFAIFGPDSIFGAGKRAQYENLPDWITPDQVRQTDYTPYVILIAGTLILMIIMVVILRSK
jgi:hypothetical protein